MLKLPQTFLKKKKEKDVTRVIYSIRSNKMALFQLDEKKIGDDNRSIKFKNKSNQDNLRKKNSKGNKQCIAINSPSNTEEQNEVKKI